MSWEWHGFSRTVPSRLGCGLALRVSSVIPLSFPPNLRYTRADVYKLLSYEVTYGVLQFLWREYDSRNQIL